MVKYCPKRGRWLVHNSIMSSIQDEEVEAVSMDLTKNGADGGDSDNGSYTPEVLDSSTAKKQGGNIFTVDEAINKMGFGPFQILITVFCGLLWVADAMELMILSILSPIVKCQWDLSSFAEASVTAVVFVGVMVGAIFWGVLNDVIGRKKSLLFVDIFVLVFGVLSALQISSDDAYLPGYPWLLICRFGVGFSSAGSSQTITYYAEFLPQKGRGFWLVMIAAWWTVGTMFCAALATVVLGVLELSWHWFLGLAATPLALVLVFFPFVPESARFHLVRGNEKKAMKVIERVARMNFKKPPSGRLVIQEDKEKELNEFVVQYKDEEVMLPDVELTRFHNLSSNDDSLAKNDGGETVPSAEKDGVEQRSSPIGSDDIVSDTESAQLLQGEDVTIHRGAMKKWQSVLKQVRSQLSPLFANGMWKTSILLWFIWFGGAWLYYGAVILTTNLIRNDPHCTRTSLNETNSTTECYELDTADYVKILWSSAAEIPGLIVTFIIIDIIGRKKSMGIEFFLSVGAYLLLLICASDVVLTTFLFITRALVTGAFQVAYVYTPEVYPTKSRALGLGICNMMARVGGILTPIFADVVFEANDYVTIVLYSATSLVFAVMAMLLPIETKGRPLQDKGH